MMPERASRADVPPSDSVLYRQATVADAERIAASRLKDSGVEPRDGALAAYLEGKHHPRDALVPRVALVALVDDQVVGYVAGHLTRRDGFDAEVQHLWVAPRYRRLGIGTELLRRQLGWFAGQAAGKVCVNVAADNAVAQAFFRRRGAHDIRQSWLGWTTTPRVA